jgi:hypothetical protein
MIRFDFDVDVDHLRPDENVGDLVRLLLLLSGRDVRDENLIRERTDRATKLLGQPRTQVSLAWEQLNELLLLVEEDRASEAFYRCFFLGEVLTDEPLQLIENWDQFKAGITRSRGFSLLAFGDFRFGFRELSGITDQKELCARLSPWSTPTATLRSRLESRPPTISELATIPRHETWQLGYLSVTALHNDLALATAIDAFASGQDLEATVQRLEAHRRADIAKILRRRYWPPPETAVSRWRSTIRGVVDDLEQLYDNQRTNQKRGVENTSRYLTWDYMDVYVATSMRQPWEFEETYVFADAVFADGDIQKLHLRWFDPTQSFDDSVPDKGLVEALMLKRARCTLYMIQEADTLGKDSELAATLAQGKPVIAYVRRIQDAQALRAFADEIAARPLAYYRRRLHTLFADGFFRNTPAVDGACDLLGSIGVTRTRDELLADTEALLTTVTKLENRRTFVQFNAEEEMLRIELKDRHPNAALLVAALDTVTLANRADTLRYSHPLAMQVHLESGVANGVLVTRSATDAAQLLTGFLTNDLRFRIQRLVPRGREHVHLGTALVEKITESYFREMTYNTTLANSFWNFYLLESQTGQ